MFQYVTIPGDVELSVGFVKMRNQNWVMIFFKLFTFNIAECEKLKKKLPFGYNCELTKITKLYVWGWKWFVFFIYIIFQAIYFFLLFSQMASPETANGFLWKLSVLPTVPIFVGYFLTILLSPIWHKRTSPLSLRPVSIFQHYNY